MAPLTLWDRRTIESVQVTVAEDEGIDGRGDFYDATGALRDVGQNHLLHLLGLTLMDAPARAAGDISAGRPALSGASSAGAGRVTR